jgi:heme oxygenase (biliverdin-IX-beta and delta-forming)
MLKLDASCGFADYRAYLRFMHAFHRAAEPSLHDGTLERAGVDMSGRAKLPWLERDLAALGIEPIPAPRLEAALLDLHRRIGWAYVLEGATLGGRVLYRSLAPRWSLDAAHGAAYLNGHGERTGAMWNGFVAQLDALPLDEEQREACVAGAQDAFARLEAWFRSNGWDEVRAA